MDIKILKEFENKKCKLILQNGFWYSNVVFRINGSCIEFLTSKGEILTIEAFYVVGVNITSYEKEGDAE